MPGPERLYHSAASRKLESAGKTLPEGVTNSNGGCSLSSWLAQRGSQPQSNAAPAYEVVWSAFRSAEFPSALLRASIPQPNAAPTYEVLRSGMVGIARQSLALRLPDKIGAFEANVAR